MRPWLSKWGGAALLGLALVAMAATAARADRILTTKRIGISGQITGLEPGGLVIDSEGNKQVVPLADGVVVRVVGGRHLQEPRGESGLLVLAAWCDRRLACRDGGGHGKNGPLHLPGGNACLTKPLAGKPPVPHRAAVTKDR